MTKAVEPAADLGAVKQRQQQTWASGDYSAIAARIVLVAEHLCDTADLHAGWHVLDVATGSGNAAIAAARHGCEVVGIDYVPSLLERGVHRARLFDLKRDSLFIAGELNQQHIINDLSRDGKQPRGDNLP